MSRISGFVPQEDLAVEALTVQEHMEFMVILNRSKYVMDSLNSTKESPRLVLQNLTNWILENRWNLPKNSVKRKFRRGYSLNDAIQWKAREVGQHVSVRNSWVEYSILSQMFDFIDSRPEWKWIEDSGRRSGLSESLSFWETWVWIVANLQNCLHSRAANGEESRWLCR